MPMPAQPELGARARADLRLLALLGTGPCASMTALVVLYALGDRDCERVVGVLWSVWGGALLLTVLSLAWLWRRWRVHVRARDTFVLRAGLALNLVSLMLVSSFLAPLLLLRPCQ